MATRESGLDAARAALRAAERDTVRDGLTGMAWGAAWNAAWAAAWAAVPGSPAARVGGGAALWPLAPGAPAAGLPPTLAALQVWSSELLADLLPGEVLELPAARGGVL